MLMRWVSLTVKPNTALFAYLELPAFMNPLSGPNHPGYFARHTRKIEPTFWLWLSCMVYAVMDTMLHKLKILSTIIRAVAIHMMNNFTLLKRATQDFRHNKYVLSDIARPCSVGVTRHQEKDIAAISATSTLPMRIDWAILLSRHGHSISDIFSFIKGVT